MSHPSLGLPPTDPHKGFPAGAAALRTEHRRLGVRALEIALDRDATLRERRSELDLRTLLRDTEVLIERLALCLAADDVHFLTEFADHLAVPYRRRRWTLDDAILLVEGLRTAVRAVLGEAEQACADAAIDAALVRLRWNRRLAGDIRKRNPIIAAIYKGG